MTHRAVRDCHIQSAVRLLWLVEHQLCDEQCQKSHTYFENRGPAWIVHMRLVIHPRQRCLFLVSAFETPLVPARSQELSAASKEEIQKSGVTVASLFLGKVFGSEAQKALTVFIALRLVKSLLLLEYY